MEEDAHLQPGEELRDRWEVKERLHKGNFGQLYVAFDKQLAEDVAIQTEMRPGNPMRKNYPGAKTTLGLEHEVLKDVDGKAHFCKMIGCGSDPAYNFMVIALCGRNLSDLHHESPHQYLSFGTAAQITIQMVEALETLHNVTGYLYNDMKPSSLVIGKGENSRVAYLVGLSKLSNHIKWITDENGNRVVKFRRRCRWFPVNYRGTVRYDSLTIHREDEKGRMDDLWSLFYVFVEMVVGRLPWSGETDRETVGNIKEKIESNQLITGMPDSLQDVLKHLESLNYKATPNYDYIKDRFRNAMRSLDIPPDEPFDWDVGYTKCQDKCPYVSPQPAPLPLTE